MEIMMEIMMEAGAGLWVVATCVKAGKVIEGRSEGLPTVDF